MPSAPQLIDAAWFNGNKCVLARVLRFMISPNAANSEGLRRVSIGYALLVPPLLAIESNALEWAGAERNDVGLRSLIMRDLDHARSIVLWGTDLLRGKAPGDHDLGDAAIGVWSATPAWLIAASSGAQRRGRPRLILPERAPGP